MWSGELIFPFITWQFYDIELIICLFSFPYLEIERIKLELVHGFNKRKKQKQKAKLSELLLLCLNRKYITSL